jgi:hypothetical protein
MKRCEQVSDRMPAVASGAGVWSEDERQHVASCESCAAEWRLLQSVDGLGARLPMPDPAVLATAVLARVRDAEATDRRSRRRRRLGWIVGLASAAALAVTVLVRQPPESETVVVPVAFELPLAELEGASDEELRAVLAEIMRDRSKIQEIAARLQAEDPELFLELVQFIQSQQGG